MQIYSFLLHIKKNIDANEEIKIIFRTEISLDNGRSPEN